MNSTLLMLMVLVGTVCFLAACPGPQPPKSENYAGKTEFGFKGGKLKDGKIITEPGVKVEKDDKAHSVIARMKDGALTITCSCILEAGGSCFPDSTPIGPDTTVIVCVSNGCGPGGGGEPFCIMEGGGDIGGEGDVFNFRTAVRATAPGKLQ